MKREFKPLNEVVQYDNKINNEINLTKLTPLELNVIESIFSTLKNKGSSEIITTFSDFRKMAKISSTYYSDNEIQTLIENTLSNISGGAITVSTKDSWSKFSIFEMLFIDYNKKEIKYKVSNPFIQYFNTFQGGYTLFPLIDFVNLKGKYSKLLYISLIRFRSTGRFEADYEHFMYEVLGAPEHLKKGGKANSVILYPALDELSDKKLFSNLEPIFKKDKNNKHRISRLIITFDPTEYKPDQNQNIPLKYLDKDLEKNFQSKLKEDRQITSMENLFEEIDEMAKDKYKIRLVYPNDQEVWEEIEDKIQNIKDIYGKREENKEFISYQIFNSDGITLVYDSNELPF